MDRLQRRRHEEVTTTRAGAMAASRRGRFYAHDGHGGPPPPAAATVPVVDQAGCTARTCRSCVAVTLADVIALGCCPCAVISLLGLAFVKAPLAVARRCLRRLRRRQGELRHKKRVRDMEPAATRAKCRGGPGAALEAFDAFAPGGCGGGGEGPEVAAAARARSSSSSSGRLDAEKVWMEMYRVGHWGFGRLSISAANTPPPPAAVRHGCAAVAEGGRKDADLRCES